MSKTKLLILFPPKFPAPSSVFSISGTGNFILPGALVWKLESVLTSSSFSHPTSHLSANPFGNTLKVHPGSHHSPLPPLSPRRSRPPYSFVWTVGLPSSVSLALVHFILSQYSQNNHLKIDLYSLKTLTLLRGNSRALLWYIRPCIIWPLLPLSSSLTLFPPLAYSSRTDPLVAPLTPVLEPLHLLLLLPGSFLPRHSHGSLSQFFQAFPQML